MSSPDEEIEDIVLDPYTEVARRFFNEFLELKIQMDRGSKTPGQQDKEIRSWRKANNELRAAAEDMSARISELEALTSNLEENNADLQRRLNEALIRGKMADRVIRTSKQYPFTEHMSEDSLREWKSIMESIPNDYKGR